MLLKVPTLQLSIYLLSVFITQHSEYYRLVPSITKKGERRYRYYVCSSAQKLGWHTCPWKAGPAAETERFVLSQIRSLSADPEFAESVLEQIGNRN